MKYRAALILFVLGLVPLVPGDLQAQQSARVSASATVRAPVQVEHGGLRFSGASDGATEVTGPLSVHGSGPAVVTVRSAAGTIETAAAYGTVRSAPPAASVDADPPAGGPAPTHEFTAVFRLGAPRADPEAEASTVSYVVSLVN